MRETDFPASHVFSLSPFAQVLSLSFSRNKEREEEEQRLFSVNGITNSYFATHRLKEEEERGHKRGLQICCTTSSVRSPSPV